MTIISNGKPELRYQLTTGEEPGYARLRVLLRDTRLALELFKGFHDSLGEAFVAYLLSCPFFEFGSEDHIRGFRAEYVDSFQTLQEVAAHISEQFEDSDANGRCYCRGPQVDESNAEEAEEEGWRSLDFWVFRDAEHVSGRNRFYLFERTLDRPTL